MRRTLISYSYILTLYLRKLYYLYIQQSPASPGPICQISPVKCGASLCGSSIRPCDVASKILSAAMTSGKPQSKLQDTSTMQQGWTLEFFVKFGWPKLSLSKTDKFWHMNNLVRHVLWGNCYKLLLCLFVLADGCRVAAASMLLWYPFESFWKKRKPLTLRCSKYSKQIGNNQQSHFW